MSLEITLYTKTATKSGLVNALLANNFFKSRHFLDEMNTPTNLHYMWFGFDDFESSTGVEATVYKASTEERKKYKCSEWVLNTRTKSSGSYEDKLMQNRTIKNLRRQFGGTFYNDWYGTNKYTDLSDYKKFTPLEKAISNISNNSIDKLEQIIDCLTEYKNERSEAIAAIKPEDVKKLFVKMDPSIILYNSLIPFLVSVVEYFFSQIFAHYIKYDQNAKESLAEEKIKLSVIEVQKILDKETSLEQIIAESYNFQNLDSINKAFKKYLFIDVYLILNKKKKAGKKIFIILKKLQQILNSRHRFIHELDINYNLTKQEYIEYVMTIKNVISLTLETFTKKGLKLELDN